MEAPSEKCAKCNWWLLLGEIREEMIDLLPYSKNGTGGIAKKIFEKKVTHFIDVFTRSAYKVCKEHWDGKR